jgi:hypothetical protein
MPLAEPVAELNRGNAIPLILKSFKRNERVKALVFLPGGIDEFYFFRRARATLPPESANLLDALVALTNQTHIHLAWRPPFVLLHGVQDPLEPVIKVADPGLEERLRRKLFERRVLWNDRDYDSTRDLMRFYLAVKLSPGTGSPGSLHFYRCSLAAFDLTVWEATEAFCLAGKVTATLEKRRASFECDGRFAGTPPLDGIKEMFLPGKH